MYNIVSMYFVFKFYIVNFIHSEFEIFVLNKWIVLFRLASLIILKFAIIKLQNYLVRIILIVMEFALCNHCTV